VLSGLDWAIIGGYLVFALWIGLATREGSGRGPRSYFLADRSLPWWWAGISVAATTFAADTPLAVAGIIADRGVSGIWMWLSWILVHAAVAVVFARRWWRADVITDAEFIAVRYADRAAPALRSFRAGLYGLVYNVIILGWVLRAMAKIAQPFVPWETWAPGLHALVGRWLPESTALGGAGDLLTIAVLVTLVTTYSSLGGIRGVVRTDLAQFALGMVGSIWLAVAAWRAVGGQRGLRGGLEALHGAEAASLVALFPSPDAGWVAALGLGAFGLGAYLLVQAFANVPADGGGYLQQRLSATRSEADAAKAAGLFIVLQYLVRIWPWLVVGLAAVVLVPIGGEPSALAPELAAAVRADREVAYPALMVALLPAGILGLLVVSLLAAFMSTIDTHFNWGASYVVKDVVLRLRPDLSPRAQIVAARTAVICFAVLAVAVAMRIDRIEQAWRWVAALGAALGVPTLLRWGWWRMTAAAELVGAVVGLIVAVATGMVALAYERQLLWIAGASLVATLATVAFGPRADAVAAGAFAAQVRPPGVWPGRSPMEGWRSLLTAVAGTAAVVAGVVGALALGHYLLLGA
jgi:Na+/proline symporter